MEHLRNHISETRRFLLHVLLGTACWLSTSCEGHSQPLNFGSLDDPRETFDPVGWRTPDFLYFLGGFSLIDTDVRTLSNLAFDWNTSPVSARIEATVRMGKTGLYEHDLNEPYDALRALAFVRYRPGPQSPLMIRAGPIKRGRLGYGHLVNFYRSDQHWDSRTVGVEGVWDSPLITLGGFVDDIRVNRVAAATLAVRPFFWSRAERLGSFETTLNHVRDLGTPTGTSRHLAGYNVEAGVRVLGTADFHLTPYFSYAWYDELGDGITLGTSIAAENLIDIARFHFRFSIDYYSDRFIPGYFNNFYRMNNSQARIIRAHDYYTGERMRVPVGTPVHESAGGSSLTHEWRFLIFQQFELWQYFRRHYGTQRLSEFQLHLFIYSQRADRLRLDIGLHRMGLDRFTSIFSSMTDQGALIMNVDYRFQGPVWISVRTRYGYRPVGISPEGVRYFVQQRRFEPMAGLRLVL